MLSEKRMFILKLLFILLPLGVFSSIPIIFAIQMKETLSYEQLLDVQDPQCPLVLFEHRTSPGRIHFKIYNAVEREPEILVMGNSLMLTYRSGLLNENSSAFYNAATTGISIDLLHFMVAEIFSQSESLPELMLVGFDPANFADPGISRSIPQLERENPATLQTTYDSGINSLLLAYERNYNFSQLLGLLETDYSTSGELLYGYQSRFFEVGYRNDGSYRFAELDDAVALHRRQISFDTWFDPENTRQPVISGDEVMPNPMYHAEQILQLAQENNVFVIGLLPSYMPSIEEYMAETGDYTYLPQAIEQLDTLFESYGFAFYSQADLPNMTFEDEVYFDGRHYSEATAAEIYLQFLADYPDLLGEYSSADWIQAQIDQAENPFDFFNEVICGDLSGQ
ncbi:MAG: hypothetical protein Phog2KO_39570 [Phototrophicaceae bacterium]